MACQGFARSARRDEAIGLAQRAQQVGAGDEAPQLPALQHQHAPAQSRQGGGQVGGVIAPGGRLIAAQPLPGLQASARPDPRDVPNNHLSYAVQWFLFALTALVIYVLAVRKKWRATAA